MTKKIKQSRKTAGGFSISRVASAMRSVPGAMRVSPKAEEAMAVLVEGVLGYALDSAVSQMKVTSKHIKPKHIAKALRTDGNMARIGGSLARKLVDDSRKRGRTAAFGKVAAHLRAKK